MSKKHKKQKQTSLEAVLQDKIRLSARDLILMIHRVNPSGRALPESEQERRYLQKSALQSKLISLYGEQLTVEPSPEKGEEFVQISLKLFDDNACHALILELDEPARRWVRTQLDELELKQLAQAKPVKRKQKRQQTLSKVTKSDPSSAEQLLEIGQQALSDYDYPAAEAAFQELIEKNPNHLDAALNLFDLWVEQLAAYEPALILYANLSESVREDERVRALMALAAARLHRTEEALSFADGISLPSIGEVYSRATQIYIAADDSTRAQAMLRQLKSLQAAPEEIAAVEAAIFQIYVKGLAPLEEEMSSAWEQGQAAKAAEIAEDLLHRWPANKAAQHISVEYQRLKQQEHVENLLNKAAEAQQLKKHLQECQFLTRALKRGAKREGLAERIEYLQQQVAEEKQREELGRFEHLWHESQRYEALLLYAGFSQLQKERAHLLLNDPLRWMDQALVAQQGRGLKRDGEAAEAVSAIVDAIHALEQGGSPRDLLISLEAKRHVYGFPEADQFLAKLQLLTQEQLVTSEHNKLAMAEQLLAQEQWQPCQKELTNITRRLLDSDAQVRWETTHKLASELQQKQTLESQFKEAQQQANHLVAMGYAKALARFYDLESRLAWTEKASLLQEKVQKEWGLTVIEKVTVPAYILEMCSTNITQTGNIQILPDGRLVLVDVFDEWVLVLIITRDEPQNTTIIILRCPETLESPTATVYQHTLWLVNQKGRVLELGLEPIAILSDIDYSQWTATPKLVDVTWIFPKGRTICMFMHMANRYSYEHYSIYDLDDKRLLRQAKVVGDPCQIRQSQGGCIVEKVGDNLQIISARGEVELSYPLLGETVVKATNHPDGDAIIAIYYREAFSRMGIGPRDQELPYLEMVVMPGHLKYIRFEEVQKWDNNYELATSMAEGLTFIWYRKISNTCILAALRPTETGLQQLYRIQIPNNVVFVQDDEDQQVFLMYADPKVGYQMIRLNEDPPHFDKDILQYQKVKPPCYTEPWVCNKMGPRTPMGPSRTIAAVLLNPQEASEDIDLSEKSMDDLLSMAEGAMRWGQHDHYKKVLNHILHHHPNHLQAQFELASRAGMVGDWKQVENLLLPIPRKGIKDNPAQHLCHMLGNAYLALGNTGEAIEVWQKGLAYETGSCVLESYLHYAHAARGDDHCDQELSRWFKRFLDVDAFIDQQDWPAAMAALEDCNFFNQNLQSTGRLVTVHLALEPKSGSSQWLSKFVIMAHFFCNVKKTKARPNIILPAPIQNIAEQQLADLSDKAQAWLNALFDAASLQ